MSVFQAVPYHVDTVAADGRTISRTPINYSYTPKSTVTYTQSSSNTGKKTMKFDMSSSVSTIFAKDKNTAVNKVGGYSNFSNFYGTVKNIESIVPGTDKFVAAVNGTAGSVKSFLSALTSKAERIENGFNSGFETISTNSGFTTGRDDVVHHVKANQYIWRYPVVTRPAPDMKTASADTKYLTKQNFVTFTLYDGAEKHNATATTDYQPIHENRNLFSYPTSVEKIENYGNRQKDLSSVRDVQFSTATNRVELTFDKITNNETTTSKKVTTAYLSQPASLMDSIYGTDLAEMSEGENGPTYTRTESTGDKIVCEISGEAATVSPLNQGYEMKMQAYVSDNGAMTLGFAVSDMDRRTKSLFNSQSVYATSADPSFVLPNKFVLSNANTGTYLPDFAANSQRESAMDMRGVRFYAVDFNRYTSNRLLGDVKYRVEVPLYNASFKRADNVRVDLYWVKDNTEASLSGKHFIGTTYVSMNGWSNNGDNRAWARFEFTPSNMESNNVNIGEHYEQRKREGFNRQFCHRCGRHSVP